MSFLSSRSVPGRVALLASSLLVTIPIAYAQIVEGHIYYYTDTATIKTDIRGNDIILGKTPGGTFGKAAGDTDITNPYTITVIFPALISSNNTSTATGYRSGIDLFNNAALHMIGGSSNTNATGYNNSSMDISGGGISYPEVHDTATLTFSGGGANFPISYDSSTINFNSGSATTLFGYDTSVINVRGGLSENANTYGNSQLNISGGTVQVFDNGYDSSTTNITGGTVGYVIPADTSTFNISGGAITYLNNLDNSRVNISGGTINFLLADSDSPTNISGGTFQEIAGVGNSVVNLSGGTISASTIYQLDDNATFHFYGQSVDFTNPVAGIYQTRTHTYTGIYYDVMWVQAMGTVDVTRFFDVNGTVGDRGPQGVFFQSSVSPEPNAFSFFAGILLVMGWRGRQQRRRSTCGRNAQGA